MKLFTKDIDTKLFEQYAKGSDLENQMVVAKIFNPYGNGTWYLLNSDPEDPEYLWAIVDMGDIEVGSVNRSDLENIKIRPFMLGLERDLSFRPVNALELYKGVNQGKHYAKGGGVESENKEMVLNNNEQIAHHTKEMNEAVKGSKYVPAWVVAKVNRSASDLSDATHYMEGQGKKYAEGGGVKFMPQQGTLLTKYKKLKLDYKKNGNNFEFVVYEGETNPVANYTKTSFKKKEKGVVTMDYKQFMNYIYAEGYIDDKNYALGGGVDDNEVKFIEYKDKEIMYEPTYNKYYANDEEFDSLEDAKNHIDGGSPLSQKTINAYRHGSFKNGGAIYKHKHMDATAKIIEKTNKGYKVEFTDNSMKKPKTKIMYFNDIDFDKEKGYFEKMATGGSTKKEFIAKKVGKVMHEFKEGTLHSGKTDKVVKNPKQAIAIGLSEGKRGWKHRGK